MKIQISDSLSLPVNAATQKMAFIGRTGSGKSYGAGKMVEGMLEAGIQTVIIDPVGIWYGLRLLADGKSPGFPIPVFGGLKGDIPLESTGGTLVADLVVDRGISIIIDVSQFESDSDKARFANDFATRFYFRKKAAPSAVHLVIEECQEFIPQNPQKGEERMLHAFQRMWKLGRNFGIGGTLISQRPQEVSKKALNQTEALFAFQMTGPQERKAIELWMSEKGIDLDIAGDLPSLKVGHCHVWSPQWLQFSEKIHIGTKTTFNSSSTPGSVGATRKQDLAPIDLTELSAKMKETIDRAKADDPRILKAEISRLKSELAHNPAVKERVVEVAVLSKEQLAEVADLERQSREFANKADLFWNKVLEWQRALEKIHRQGVPVTAYPKIVHQTPRKGPENAAVDQPSGELSPAHQRIIDVVGMLGVRGITPTRDSIARWLDLHPNGGSYNTNLGWLRAEGYLQGCQLTPKGAAATKEIASGFEAAKQPLDGSQRRILDILRESNGGRFNRETLAAALVLHPNGGSYNTNLGRLRTMGLIPERGEIYLLETAER